MSETRAQYGEAGEAKRELLCENCGRRYAAWFAPNELWNAVVKEDGYSFLCPTCFTGWAVALGMDDVFVLSTDTEPHEREAELIHEVERLREALRDIAEGHDAGRHDGFSEPCPALDAETMFAIARAALNHAAPSAQHEGE